MRTARALALCCHPLPTVAVTVLGAVLAALAGAGPGTTALVALAVLTGQLVIGWTNDLVDVRRDRAADRTDKPYARGDVGRTTLLVAVVVAAVATVAASLALGPRAAVAQLTLVVAGVVYDLGVKATVLSPVPYLVGFGALPAAGWYAAGAGPPPWWVTVTAALVGGAAHLGNVLPDLADDAATGVRGVPQRLGRRGSAYGAAVVLLTVGVVLLAAPGRAVRPGEVLVAVVVVLLGGGVVATSRRGRVAFLLTVAAAGTAVVLLALRL